jgi:hypothetical protein
MLVSDSGCFCIEVMRWVDINRRCFPFDLFPFPHLSYIGFLLITCSDASNPSESLRNSVVLVPIIYWLGQRRIPFEITIPECSNDAARKDSDYVHDQDLWYVFYSSVL